MNGRVLPALVDGPDELTLRRWTTSDAKALDRAISQSVEHLRPWMPWVAREPLSLRERIETIRAWEEGWARGEDVFLGIFLAEKIAGGSALHRRIAPDGLEIGYWIHPAFLRRGLATEVARLLTDAGLSASGITHTEIHHDKANRPSAAIPPKLG